MTTSIYSIFRSVGIGQKTLRKVARQELQQTSEQYNGQKATEDLKYIHLYIYSFFFRNVRQKFFGVKDFLFWFPIRKIEKMIFYGVRFITNFFGYKISFCGKY